VRDNLVLDTPKSIICQARQGFEHLHLLNLDLFRISILGFRISPVPGCRKLQRSKDLEPASPNPCMP
ncbi:MAG: hypothetical protein ACETWQ_16875, partial [Phycisphaerae bacterium]